MNSRITDEFRSCFARLPEQVRAQARRAYQLWGHNPFHPSLRFKKIHGSENLYSVRVGIDWRALGLLERDMMTWFWIGSHAEYDRLVS